MLLLCFPRATSKTQPVHACLCRVIFLKPELPLPMRSMRCRVRAKKSLSPSVLRRRITTTKGRDCCAVHSTSWSQHVAGTNQTCRSAHAVDLRKTPTRTLPAAATATLRSRVQVSCAAAVSQFAITGPFYHHFCSCSHRPRPGSGSRCKSAR